MVRILVYGFTGLLLGAFLGLVTLAFNASLGLSALGGGALLGLLVGCGIAAYMNSHGVLDGPFVTEQGANGILVSEADVQNKLDLPFPFSGDAPRPGVAWQFRVWPAPIARWLTSKTQLLLEKGEDVNIQ